MTTTSAVLQEAFTRPTEYDSAIIRQRVVADVNQIPGAAVWPNGMGFDITEDISVSYNDGRPWVVFSGSVNESAAAVPGRQCPQCGTTLNKLTGQDGHQVVQLIDRSERKLLATIWTCPSCEHCEGGL